MSDVFWAAFGGGAAAGIFTLVALGFAEWLKWFLDRPLVHVRIMWVLSLNYSSGGENKRISLEAINPHTKPVTLSGIGFGYKKRKEQLIIMNPEPMSFPYELSGGKSISEYIDIKSIVDALKKSNISPEELSDAWYRVQSGDIFKCRLHKNLIQEIKLKFDTK